MNFIIINKDFLGIYKDTFGLIDIIEADFIPTLSHVSICFVVKIDIDKLNFLKEKYSVCYNEYLFYIEKNGQYKDYKYEFMVLSKEEVNRDFDGNYYYAMH